jgi:RHS repeat-associated protein
VLSATGRENQPTITPIWDDSYRSDDNSTTTAYTQNYSYDKLGNIQQLQHIGTNSFTRNFNYTTNNNQLQNVQIGLTTYAFTYDACGNQLTETTSRHWEWDDKNMARCFYVEASGNVTQYTQYLYNAEGKRVKKLVWKQSGDFDSYTYIDDNYEYRINEIGREQTLHHVMDNESRLAIIREGFAFGDTTPAIKYNLQNFIGSSTVYLDNGGSNVNFEEYYPFGETSFGSYALKRYKYCGKERDIESGLIYYGARYCSAWTCRFVSVDPLAQDYMYLTPYNNAGNRPIIAKDIDGMQTPENKKDSGGGQTNNINSTNVGGKLTKADAGDETNPSINNSSSSSNNILSAPTGGANGFPDKILPKFDLKFLTKNNIANKPVDDGKPKFEALTPEKIFRINQTMQARAAYKTLSSYNDFELGMITSPVIQSIAQGGLAITGGAFINRSLPYLSTTLSNAYTNLGRGQYFVDGALNASSNFIGQLAFNNGNLRKVDYADLGFSFAFNKANIWHVGFNTSFSTMVDINAIDKPFLFFMNGVDKSTNRLGYDFLSNLGFNYGNMKFSQMVDKSSSFFVGKGTPFILNTMGSGFQTAGSNYIFDSKK